jgi:voltage-gated potassium channel
MDQRSRNWERRFEIPVAIAALATIPLLVFERRHLAPSGGTLLRVADWLVWAVFALEAVTLAAVAPSRPGWLKSHPLEVAIVVLTVPVIPAAFQALRVLRLLRLLRLVRLAPLSRRLFSLSGLRYAAFLALLTMLGGGTAFADVEKVSLGRGIYWALSTMTTNSNLVPRTAEGRVVSALVMVLGVAFFAMITGAIAQRFLASEVAEIEEEMGEVEHEMGKVEGLVQESEAQQRDIVVSQREALDELHAIAVRLQALEIRLRTAPEGPAT